MFDQHQLSLHPRNDDGTESEGGGTAGSGGGSKPDREIRPEGEPRD